MGSARNFLAMGFLMLLMAGCATGYHSTGATGGYDETKLADDLYQVRFEGNAYTRSGRVAQFLLRRGAELALENGERWFRMRDAAQGNRTSGAPGWGVMSFPSGTAIVEILDDDGEAEGAFDAVTVVTETNEEAGGALSPEAREHYMRLKHESEGSS